MEGQPRLARMETSWDGGMRGALKSRRSFAALGGVQILGPKVLGPDIDFSQFKVLRTPRRSFTLCAAPGPLRNMRFVAYISRGTVLVAWG